MKAQHEKPVVLICSDNPDLYLLLSHILVCDGYQTTLVGEEDVVTQASSRPTAAVILDSAKDTDLILRACAAIKGTASTSHIPTIGLVPAGEECHYLALLKAGIDENFVRPVSPARLLSYLNSLPRGRLGGVQPPDASFAHLGGSDVLRLKADRRAVAYGGCEAQLGPIEFQLLRCLLEAPGRVFSRQELIDAAWPSNFFVQARTVDVHVGRLRRSLLRLTGRNLIRTVRASGYAIELEEARL
ncbi:response regulator transcription factor [Sinorhizobium sp. NFACC03]|uniref:response regulator transcription factor n=1 Tax=Sinorhizobium sp. NFACC03 TaxID=1566295 RepID=UPI00088B04DF|nr:response regulator transcription factor [Sinorhizobium sp. NFACC03]SDA87618.1 two-component system, OmpR family, phosphate regulon response regulator PhoB [Sinorhizobium sp. NFACC03]